jgi:hypothetical protein
MWAEYLILCPSLYVRVFDPEVIVLLLTLGSSKVCLNKIKKTTRFYALGKTVSLLQRLVCAVSEVVYLSRPFWEVEEARKLIQ